MVFNIVLNDIVLNVLIFELSVAFDGDIDEVDEVEDYDWASNDDRVEYSYKIAESSCEA